MFRMKVEYLYSRRQKMIGSRAIAWASSFEKDLKHIDPTRIPSHAAVLLGSGLVIESVMDQGVRIVPYKKWLEINEELYKVPSMKEDFSKEEIDELLVEMWGRKYDKKGIGYFAWCFLKLILFKTEMPVHNKYEHPNKFFCTEFAGRLEGLEDYSMITPARMCSNMLKRVSQKK